MGAPRFVLIGGISRFGALFGLLRGGTLLSVPPRIDFH